MNNIFSIDMVDITMLAIKGCEYTVAVFASIGIILWNYIMYTMAHIYNILTTYIFNKDMIKVCLQYIIASTCMYKTLYILFNVVLDLAMVMIAWLNIMDERIWTDDSAIGMPMYIFVLSSMSLYIHLHMYKSEYINSVNALYTSSIGEYCKRNDSYMFSLLSSNNKENINGYVVCIFEYKYKIMLYILAMVYFATDRHSVIYSNMYENLYILLSIRMFMVFMSWNIYICSNLVILFSDLINSLETFSAILDVVTCDGEDELEDEFKNNSDDMKGLEPDEIEAIRAGASFNNYNQAVDDLAIYKRDEVAFSNHKLKYRDVLLTINNLFSIDYDSSRCVSSGSVSPIEYEKVDNKDRSNSVKEESSGINNSWLRWSTRTNKSDTE